VYNTTALAEILIQDYDKIIQDRLQDVALMREKARHNLKIVPTLRKEDIDHDEMSNLFFVKSQSDSENYYLVDGTCAVCTCSAGL
jgi:hypothetical protein